MNPVKAIVPLLAAATLFVAHHTAQGGPPKVRPYTPPGTCFTREEFRAPFNNKWARLLTGDEWIEGCLGAEGPCVVVIWIPC